MTIRRFKKEDGVALLLTIIPVVIAYCLLSHCWKEIHWHPFLEKQNLESAANTAKRNLEEAERTLNNTPLPGPEPWWVLHPWDYYVVWKPRKDAYDNMVHACEEARIKNASAQNELKGWMKAPSIPPVIKKTWNDVVSPILHFLFALALICLSARAVFRYLLMKGKIGVVQL